MDTPRTTLGANVPDVVFTISGCITPDVAGAFL